jgi:lipopolysaccharide/colanic/teichoic acid biosynthesis glycosyltransferase
VLKGDLSLGGAASRATGAEEILYYNARDSIIRGMTDWAQVNGFRGDTDLNERILDSYFIENHPRLSDHVYDLLRAQARLGAAAQPL